MTGNMTGYDLTGGNKENESHPVTKIKFCGLRRPCDIEAANELGVDYAGFVFAEKSRRFVSKEQAAALKALLSPKIKAVGVFVDEKAEKIAELCKEGIIDAVQLHGNESEDHIKSLRALTHVPVIRAFRISGEEDMKEAVRSSADIILLDSGAGTGTVFDWKLLRGMERPFFLAGGLDPFNVSEAVRALHPFGVDVSSGIETEGFKDINRMKAFKEAVIKGEMNHE